MAPTRRPVRPAELTGARLAARFRRRLLARLALAAAVLVAANVAVYRWATRERPPARAVVGAWDVWLDVPVATPEQARSALARAAAALARREVTFVWAREAWTFRLDELGVALDTGALANGVLAALPLRPGAPPPGVAPVAAVDEARLRQALAPAAAAVALAPVVARLEVVAGVPAISPDTAGRRLDHGGALAALRDALARQPDPGAAPWRPDQALPPLRLELPVVPEPAPVTAEGLAALGIRRRIAVFTTRYDPAIPRGENVERAARALDGVLLRPGEILSYAALVGPVDPDSGWRQAYVILGGELVPGIGGGICQTATTLYGAALRAGLEVVERHPHQLSVAYIQPSQDAAYAPGAQDLKIRNAGPTGALFRTRAGGGEVTVEVWGDAPPDRVIAIESEVVGTVPPPVRVVPAPDLPPGEEVVQLEGHAGFRSVSYLVVYRDGRVVSRQRLNADTYAPTPRVVRRGVAPPG